MANVWGGVVRVVLFTLSAAASLLIGAEKSPQSSSSNVFEAVRSTSDVAGALAE
jgi:hypothetical protein